MQIRLISSHAVLPALQLSAPAEDNLTISRQARQLLRTSPRSIPIDFFARNQHKRDGDKRLQGFGSLKNNQEGFS
jgi:hypothetical protein